MTRPNNFDLVGLAAAGQVMAYHGIQHFAAPAARLADLDLLAAHLYYSTGVWPTCA
jgi:hypothetical protein